MQKGGQGSGAGSGLMLLLQTADVQHKVYGFLIVALPIPSGLEIVRDGAGTLIHLRVLPPHLGQHPADPLLHLPAGGKSLDEVAQMHGKPGIRKALFVERNIKLFLHDAVHVRKGLERHHHGVHIARFRLGVDEVEGNVHHLAVWQLQPGFPCQQLPCLFGQLCLLGVQVAHIVGQRGRDFDALSQPLRRKVQVVGQGKGQVWVQRSMRAAI